MKCQYINYTKFIICKEGKGMNNEKMIEVIRSLCKSKNITPTKLEEDLGFSQGLISRWKDKNPNIDRIIDIADYFKVSLDEVVGRDQIVIDNFISSLIEETENNNIIWHKYNDKVNFVKQYYGENINPNDFIDSDQFEDYLNSHASISYYSTYSEGYISIYSFYKKFEIIKPNDIKLFIQPGINAELIPQKYNKDELLPLWLKVIYALGYEQPDEVKAEELKNAFILNKSLTNSTDSLSGGLNNYPDTEILSKVANDPAVQQLIELYNKPEFQKMQQVIISHEFQAAVKVANRIQKQLDKK